MIYSQSSNQLSFFFLMIRRPPRSTLFPYNDALPISNVVLINLRELPPLWATTIPPLGLRSEEHTSELQSHLNLVCRLLLEKKKNISKSEYVYIPMRRVLTLTNT